MTRKDIKKSMIIGVISGITSAITILILVWTYIKVEDWYEDYIDKLNEGKGQPTQCRGLTPELSDSISSADIFSNTKDTFSLEDK